MAMKTMKSASILIGLSVFSVTIGAEQTDPCASLSGAALTQCRSNQQTLQLQQQLEHQLQQQQERQNQLDKQQRDVQQQLENLRQQNETLRKQLDSQASALAARPVATASAEDAQNRELSKAQDLKTWKADNPWFGFDYPRTQFAMRYIKQLQKEHPDLNEHDLLDAVSTKVNETFGPPH